MQRATDCFVQLLPTKPTIFSRETHRLYAGNDASRLLTYERWMRPEIAGILCVRTENVTGGLIQLSPRASRDLSLKVSRQLRTGDLLVWDMRKYDFRMSMLEAYMPGEGETFADFITYFSSAHVMEGGQGTHTHIH